MIVPMVISKRNEFIQIALIATILSVLGALFGYYIGYSLYEIAIQIFEFYGYEYSVTFKEKFSTGGGFKTPLHKSPVVFRNSVPAEFIVLSLVF